MRVGIIGAGQLAQLLAHSAYGLGIETLCYADSKDYPAARFSPIYEGSIQDQKALIDFAKSCQVVTIENENIDINYLKLLSKESHLAPGLEIIKAAQDRWLEKTLFQSLEITTTKFVAIDTYEDLERNIDDIGLPAILKSRRFGYDGKGQYLIRNTQELRTAWEHIAKVPAILEAYVNFDFEVSLISARNNSGHEIFYPLNKNKHESGILRSTETPFIDPFLQKTAELYTSKILKYFKYEGVLAFEFFVKGQQLIANEIAPRVHNSGHGSIEGFNISQFESHLRAVLNLPLISPQMRTATIMENIIGEFPNFTKEKYHHSHIYDYGKSPRPGRKLGHMTHFDY